MKKESIKKLHLLVIVILVLGLNACKSAYKMVEEGRYDDAVALEIKKLAGKKKKNPKHVKWLEDAFQKATEKDLATIKQLKEENRPENWEEIIHIAQKLQRRQNAIEPFLPLIDKNGYEARFRFVKADIIENEATEKTVEYFYTRGNQFLAEARKGDKSSARKAFYEFEKIKRYYNHYRDEKELMDEAVILGKTRMVFEMQNDARVILPEQFEDEILRIGVGDLNSLWNEVHMNAKPGLAYDYSIVMSLTDIEVSPESILEKQYIDEKEIQDGFVYELDENGNVRKDTLGNDIKSPRYRLIRASIFEVMQQKFAKVGGRLEYRDNKSGDLIRTEPIFVDAVFEHYASTFSGDRRALCDRSLGNINNRPIPFPSDEGLLMEAADHLKPIVEKKIRSSRLL